MNRFNANNREIEIRKLNSSDFDALCDYFGKLKPETVNRFGPHPFDKETLIKMYHMEDTHTGYLAIDLELQEIIAYAIIKHGFLEHDQPRLISFGFYPDNKTDCTFAPSVADHCQSFGIGNALFKYIVMSIKELGFKRMILWGGVQANNTKAINFYKKHGFIELGQFEYNGWNLDMVKYLD